MYLSAVSNRWRILSKKWQNCIYLVENVENGFKSGTAHRFVKRLLKWSVWYCFSLNLLNNRRNDEKNISSRDKGCKINKLDFYLGIEVLDTLYNIVLSTKGKLLGYASKT